MGGLAVVFALPSSSSSSSSSSSTSAPAPADVAATATPALAPASSPPPSVEDTRALITEVGRVVREGLGGWGWDGVGLGIGVGDGTADEWEDLCAEWGLEFVQVRGGKKDDGRNEFGGSYFTFLSCLFFFVSAFWLSFSRLGPFSLRFIPLSLASTVEGRFEKKGPWESRAPLSRNLPLFGTTLKAPPR